MILGFANSPNVNLVINNDIALDPNFGTDVNNALAERLVKTNNLSDLDDVAAARSNLGAAEESVVNSMINDRLLKSDNLSDLENVTTARSNLGLGSAAIANNATESNQGIAKIATQSEVNGGTNDENFITPLKYFNGFANSKSTNGYTYLPNGLIIQWGSTGNISQATNHTITLPIAFPNANLVVTASHYQSSWSHTGTTDSALMVNSRTNSNFKIAKNFNGSAAANNRPASWIAIGY
jgi:hypothetical protein